MKYLFFGRNPEISFFSFMKPLFLSRYLLNVLLVGILYLPANVSADRIIIAADRWCPFNCGSSDELPGFMVEVAQKVFAASGHEVHYVEMNWSRAIEETRHGRVNAIIGAFKGDAPDFVFPIEEMTVIENSLFVLKDSTWAFEGISSLKNQRLGAILGYDYGEKLNEYIKGSNSPSVIVLSGDIHPLKRGIRMLKLHRIDAMVETGDVFRYTARELGFTDDFKSVGSVSEPMKAYIAFSPALDKSHDYAKLLSEGIARLRASGELTHILGKYGLNDWR